MAILSGCYCIDILVFVATILIGVYTYIKWTYRLWERKNIPYIQPTIPLGTMANPFAKPISFSEHCKERYEESKGKKHLGLFILTSPLYMPLTLEYVKIILAQDFDHFVDRGIYYNEKDDPLSAHLFMLDGQKWRNIRVKLTPTFTTAKMKMMFNTLVECGKQLTKAMNTKCSTAEPVDIKDFLARYTIDGIGSTAFGLDCNSFEHPNSDFRTYGQRVFTPTKFELLLSILPFAYPSVARFFRMRSLPTEVSTFFLKVIKETVAHREKNNISRKDFLQLLIDIKDNVKKGEEKGLTINELAAQSFIFFLGGYETSSTTLAFCFYELACNPDIQERLRDEIEKVLEIHDGKITYESISEMNYMSQVIDETLRKYPAIPSLNRQCVKDYTFPDGSLTLDKGTSVVIPVLALHHDPDYFPDPDVFDPERFSTENKPKIKPFSYLPFGEGPRACIGLRYGLLQTKVGITSLLKNFKFSVTEQTKIPLEMDPLNLILSSKDTIFLNVERI